MSLKEVSSLQHMMQGISPTAHIKHTGGELGSDLGVIWEQEIKRSLVID